MLSTDFLLERRLAQLSPELSVRFKDCVLVMTEMLEHYKQWFPTYTDHSARHSMDVIEFCNSVIGQSNVMKMNADEIFVLLLGCYLHDSGMCLSEKDYRRFFRNISAEELLPQDDPRAIQACIRKYHHEFSGEFVKAYGDFFEIPSPEHIFCVTQIARGHRKADLYDEKEYPAAYPVPGGNTVCLPYLAALIRMTDEIDVAVDRNPIQNYVGIEDLDHIGYLEWARAFAIKHVEFRGNEFVLYVQTESDEVYQNVLNNNVKIQETLDYCREVTARRTAFTIYQDKVSVERMQ